MNTPESVAILEDNAQMGGEIKEQLIAKGMHAELFLTRNDFRQSIGRGALYDLIVLDWYFEDPTNSVQAQLVLLQDLPKYRYLPVVVYTEEPDAAAAEIEGLSRPANRTPCFPKSEVTPEALAERVFKWYEASFSARLSAVWRRVRSVAFEQSLYELDALESTEFQRTLQRLLLVEAEETFDVDHALEFLERYVSRKVVGNSELRETLNAELAREQLPTPQTKQEKQAARLREPALVNAHAYILCADRIARTGDVVKVTFPTGSLIAVVLTPICDLASVKCAELRLVEAEELDREAARDAEWQLPPFKNPTGVFITPVVNFHRTLFVTPTERQEKHLIRYDQRFRDRFGTEVTLECLCRLDDPYRSDLLQKYSSHASRVGVP
jgi:hypothetical protein